MKNLAFYGVIVLAFVAYKAYTEAGRDDSGAIVDAGSMDVFQLRVGDCFDDTDNLDEISSLPAVPCSEPHDNEAYARFDMTIPEYPQGDGMFEMAYDACLDRFEPFVGRDYESSNLDIMTLYPTIESWRQNDREVICAVYDLDADKLVGTVKGLGI